MASLCAGYLFVTYTTGPCCMLYVCMLYDVCMCVYGPRGSIIVVMERQNIKQKPGKLIHFLGAMVICCFVLNMWYIAVYRTGTVRLQ